MLAQEGLEEPSHVECQEEWWEEIPLIQGKKQQLRFAGVGMKRYPHIQGKTAGAVRGHQRADTLKS